MAAPHNSSDTAFGFEQPGESPGFLLWQVSQAWQRQQTQALKPFGITHTQFVLLAVLRWMEEQKKAPTQASLAEMAELDVMLVSSVIRRLEAAKWVERAVHPSDPRARLPRLTPAGAELIIKAVPVVEAVDAAFFEVLQTQVSSFTGGLSALAGQHGRSTQATQRTAPAKVGK